MTTARDPIYAGYRYPAEIISYAVWLYFRFPLSLRMVEEILAARGLSVAYETIRQWGLKFGRASHEFAVYIASNVGSLINYGERFRADERISLCLAESTVNAVISKRFAKRQQMQWTKRGAHLLLQTRTRTLDGTLRLLFEQWYPRLANDNAAGAGKAAAA